MRVLLLAVLTFSLSACNLVFKLPTRQGNVIEQKQLDQLKPGMTHEQVTYLMGTPIAASPFRQNRWDYVGYYKSPRGKLSTRTVTLYFEQGLLAKMDGIASSTAMPLPQGSEDAAEIFKQQKREKNEDERATPPPEGGVVISAPSNTP